MKTKIQKIINHLSKVYFIFFLFLPVTAVYAEPLECHTTTEDGAKIDLTMFNSKSGGLKAFFQVETKGGKKLSGHYYNLTQLWDEHNAGLMTSDGISITYNNAFGRIYNVEVFAYLSDDGIIHGTSDGHIKSYSLSNCTTKA